jgi:endonuclease/exonuclease/phosphatase (EEP) superfamily protein YafD
VEIILSLQSLLSILMLVAILLPVVKNTYWVFRIFEYPRFQIWLLSVLVAISWLATLNHTSGFHQLLMGSLVLGLIYLSYKIWPYTPLARRQVKTLKGSGNDNEIVIFTANVYQDNREYSRLLAQIQKNSPTIVLLVETDEEWKKNTDALLESHPHYLGKALSNTYGMLLYSNCKIVKGAVEYLVEQDIPSIEATIELPSGQQVNIWAVHPKPPVPGESEDSKAKDSEIMKVAFKAEKSELPVIVMGDFNDVAWSKVTELFQKTAKLLDPRRGRGFYSTFSAHSKLVRFPLDYIFCSNDFGLIKMKGMPYNGSDHFAVLTHLRHDKHLKKNQQVEKADAEERKEARKKEMAVD